MKKLGLLALGTCLFGGAIGMAFAQQQVEPQYVDDRSDGAALIRSLYNAINRKEYPRAYSYFSEDKNVVDYPTFAKGYAGTADVKVFIGSVKPEGAAGSLYSPVPVAIESTQTDGKVRVFAGCYITRMANSAVQEPPFTPLHIESAELKEIEGPAENAVPKACTPPS